MTKPGVLQGRGAHAIRTRIMVFGEGFTFFIMVSSGSASGIHVDAFGTIVEPIWALLDVYWDLWGSLGLPWSLLGGVSGLSGSSLGAAWLHHGAL